MCVRVCAHFGSKIVLDMCVFILISYLLIHSMCIVCLIIIMVVVFFVKYWRHPRVRAFITGNKVQVAAVGRGGSRGSSASNEREFSPLTDP